jgi:hypothetical protein
LRRFIPGMVVACLLTFTAAAVGFPPFTVTDVTQSSATIRGLDCGTQYRIRVDDRNAAGTGWENTTTQTTTTAACPAGPPTANFTVSPNPAVRNQATRFSFTGTCPAAPCSYQWLHGDATSTEQIGTGASVSFTYTGTPGPRSVTLKVTDGQSRSATSTQSFQLVGSAATPTPTPTPTPTATATPTPTPTAGGFPDAASTGVPAGTTLTPSGALTINTAGTVIDGRDISGQVVVNAPNVTIKNSRIRTNAMFAVENNSTGLLVEDSEIANVVQAGHPNCHVGIGSSDFTVLRTDISGCENGLNIDSPGNVTMQDSYIHDLDTVGPSYVFGDSGPHTDGVQIGQSAHNITFSHDTIDPSPGGGVTSGIIMYVGSSNPNYDIHFEGNYIDGRGASYAIYAPRAQTHDVYMNDNRVYKGVYGYTDCVRPGITVTQFNGNLDMGTGAPIPADNGAGGACED